MTTETFSLEAFEASLPPLTQPLANYVTAVQVDNLIYTSGVLPMKDGVVQYQGPAGEITMSVDTARDAARLCCLNLMSTLKDKLGSLARVVQVVKLTGYVNSTASFTAHPQVINGASDFLVEVFGEKGKHARAAIGVQSLPLDATVELDLIVQVSP